MVSFLKIYKIIDIQPIAKSGTPKKNFIEPTPNISYISLTSTFALFTKTSVNEFTTPLVAPNPISCPNCQFSLLYPVIMELIVLIAVPTKTFAFTLCSNDSAIVDTDADVKPLINPFIPCCCDFLL